jgi:PiT family inorganic phosphate transporter
MHKKLQLLSSAAFSLGHGGADSQKVMGIICAALLVYGNMARKEGKENNIGKQFAITELMQVEFHNKQGKLEKFKPEFAVVHKHTYYLKHSNKDADYASVFISMFALEKSKNAAIVDESNGKVVYDFEKKLSISYKNSEVPKYDKIIKEMQKIEVYQNGDSLCDAKTKEPIFINKKLNTNYLHAGIFREVVTPNGELKSGFKIKTKVHSETMPFWIAFGCYLMIGLGTLMGGWKIVKTMGSRITKVTPLEGVCAETAGALTLFTVSNFGIPVSTTHTITGSIIGVGATRRISAVRWGVTINLLWAWILTIPVSALLAAVFYYIIGAFH